MKKSRITAAPSGSAHSSSAATAAANHTTKLPNSGAAANAASNSRAHKLTEKAVPHNSRTSAKKDHLKQVKVCSSQT